VQQIEEVAEGRARMQRQPGGSTGPTNQTTAR
jgi:hypothetical protein